MRRTQGPSSVVRYSHLGIQFALVVILGIWGGAQLDKRLSTNFFTLVGTFVGAGIGFYFLYREIRRFSDPDDAPDAGAGSAADTSPRSGESAPDDSPTQDPGGADGRHDSARGNRDNSDRTPGR